MPTLPRTLSALLLAMTAACGAPPVALTPTPAEPAGSSAEVHRLASPAASRDASDDEAKLASSAAKSNPEGQHSAALATEVAAEPEPPPVLPELLSGCGEKRSIAVFKAARQLELRCGERVAGRYGISLGFEPVGDKHHEGDGRTPEGEYFITGKFSSQFHRSLQLTYPNAADADRGLAENQISQHQHAAIVKALQSCRRPLQNTALGSLLQIHGGGGGPEYNDWTLGCVALPNDAIEAAYAFHVPGCDDGKPRTPVYIFP